MACGPAFPSPLIQSWTPRWEGMRPVRIVARLGDQTGVATKKFWKRTPVAASRSMFGVRISGLP